MKERGKTLTENFFVYGTLKVGGHFGNSFDRVRESSEPAVLSGYDLFNLGWFPTIKKGAGKVIGEVHTYKNFKEVLSNFDNIEGYGGNPEQSLFLRKEAEVETASGKKVSAIVYEFVGDLPENAEKVDSGIWEI